MNSNIATILSLREQTNHHAEARGRGENVVARRAILLMCGGKELTGKYWTLVF
jgi:hypothetical protein